jgi:hypothetical protein
MAPLHGRIDLVDGGEPVNELLKKFIYGSEVVIERYALPVAGER